MSLLLFSILKAIAMSRISVGSKNFDFDLNIETNDFNLEILYNQNYFEINDFEVKFMLDFLPIFYQI